VVTAVNSVRFEEFVATDIVPVPPFSRTFSYYCNGLGKACRIALRKSVGKTVFGRTARGGR
jgi:hypothetical protein